MRRLLLLRHAKSSWANPDLRDRDRPLSKRGLRDAPRMGRHLVEQGLMPDRVLCSPAVRTRDTLALVSSAAGAEPPVNYAAALYDTGEGEGGGGVRRVRALIAETPENVSVLLVVGHMPEIQLLVEELTGEEFPYGKYSTCGLAVVDFAVERWSEIDQERGQLSHFMRPKDLPDSSS